MNVGLYSGAAGMRIGEDYQSLVSENLSLGAIPGHKQTLPVFSTDPAVITGKGQSPAAGNAAAVRMTRVIDFSQGTLQPTGEPYNLAIEGQAFFQVREADGSTTYTRNGAFSVSPQGQVHTSDGAAVLSKGGSPLTVSPNTTGPVSIASDGTISINGEVKGSVGFSHFDNPSASLQTGPYGRFIAANKDDAKSGLGKNDTVIQGSLEQSNGNPVQQMADMIQAVRLYEANSKSIKAVDDTQNQLISNLGGHPQG